MGEIMVYDFNKKIVVITGASKGIGRELAIAMIKRGAIVIGAARSTELLKNMEESTQTLPGNFLPYTTDLLSDDGVSSLVDKAMEHDGAHVLVLNAGEFEQNYFPTTERSKRMYSLNTVSPIELLRQYMDRAIKYTPKNSLEMVVVILSESAIKPYPGSVVYTGTKVSLLFGLLGIEEELAEERTTETEYGEQYKKLFRNTRFRYIYFSSVDTGIWRASRENTYGPIDMWAKIPLDIAVQHALMAIDGTYEHNHIGILTDYNSTDRGYPIIVEDYGIVREVAPTLGQLVRVDFANPIKREIVDYFK